MNDEGYSEKVFRNSISRYNHLSQNKTPFPKIVAPTRLINIYTGALEAGTPQTGYVIGSYLWTPEVNVPYDTLPNIRLPYTVVDSPHFDTYLDKLCQRLPTIIARVAELDYAVQEFRFPAIDACPWLLHDSRGYFEEVFRMLAMEARRRGVQHVWIDAICIIQQDKDDIAHELPRMRCYYQSAECTVVVSEVLRRRMAPNIEETTTGINMLGLEKVMKHFEIEHHIDEMEGWEWNLLASWAGGFHGLRTWTFQETYLAREVITMSNHVRIRTSYLFSINKKGEDNHIIISGLVENLPVRESVSNAGIEITPENCMEKCRKRQTTVPNDRIYGLLGLFPDIIRFSVPTDYTLPLDSLLCIFIYIRVCSGDISALFFLQDDEYEPILASAPYPSWVPRAFGYRFQEFGDANFHARPELDVSVSHFGIHPPTLTLTTPYISVQEVCKIMDGVYTNPSLRQENFAVTLDPANYGFVDINVLKPILQSNPGTLFHPGIIEPSGPSGDTPRPLPLTRKAAKNEQLRDEKINVLTAAAAAGKLVIVSIGVLKWTQEGVPDWGVWLLLRKCDGNQEGPELWKKQGFVVTYRIQEELLHKKTFCIM